MAVSRRLRFEILRRDGMTCRYCGAKAPDVPLTVDHVIPIALGGGDEPNNLVTACKDCNAGKSSVPADAALVEEVDSTAILFAKAIEWAAADRRKRLQEADAELAWFETKVWGNWSHPIGGERAPVPKDDDWRASVERFMAAGLNMDDLTGLVEVAMRSKAIIDEKWRYFCGCCWRSITEIQEDARRYLEDQAAAENPVGHPIDGDYLA